MELNVNGAIFNSEVVSAIKNIQECKGIHLDIIDKQMNLLISQRGNIQESDAEIMERLEDLNLLKGLLKSICNGIGNEHNG
ncbi:MAG: hypothetical protein ACK5M3_16025 [Dysgonomonas sp.]